MKSVFLSVICIVLALVLCFLSYAKWGALWHATTKEASTLHGLESEAAYPAKGNLNAGAQLKQGEEVAVLWDTYGKDYWACFVRTGSSQRGWVLCTSLEASS